MYILHTWIYLIFCTLKCLQYTYLLWF